MLAQLAQVARVSLDEEDSEGEEDEDDDDTAENNGAADDDVLSQASSGLSSLNRSLSRTKSRKLDQSMSSKSKQAVKKLKTNLLRGLNEKFPCNEGQHELRESELEWLISIAFGNLFTPSQ